MYRSIVNPELTWSSAENLNATREALIASIGQEAASAKTEYWVVELVEDPE